MTTPDIAGLCEELRASANAICDDPPFHDREGDPVPPVVDPDKLFDAADTLERQAAEIERLRDSAAKTFADVVFLRKDHPGQSEQFYAEEASSLCRRALAALTGEDTATLGLSGKTQTDDCTRGDG